MSASTLAWFALGLGALIGGAEALVRGAVRLSAGLGISPLVVGLTVVAFGTSAPELAVSLQAAAAGQGDICIGNVVGSNIFNVLLILGVSAAITPLAVSQQLIRLDVPLMIAASALVLLLGLDGRVGRVEGGVLLAGIVAYTGFLVRRSPLETQPVREEYAAQFGAPRPGAGLGWLRDAALVGGGLLLLVLGARWLVDGAVTLARTFGVSELVIGLTLVAAGTSLPEVATSVVASLRGERDIAVGNVVGSNLFNLLAVLGVAALAAPEGVPVSAAALRFDIPVMIAVALACLPIFFTGHRIARWEGFLFLGYYGAYTAYLVLRSGQHQALPAFSRAMAMFVLPITAVTLSVLAFRALRARLPPAG